jgi:nicotinamidase/pyrazinamidase
MGAKKPRPKREREEELLDEALEESFPASDPASLVQPEGGISGPEEALQPGDALIVVDVQRDFCPGGALPIENGDAVVPVLNRWIDQARRLGIPVIASRDWHPQRHLSFKPEGGEWPVHCVQGTPGAAFHPDLDLPPDAEIVTKGDRTDRDQYSAFDATGLAEELRRHGVKRVFVGGLAEDVCVRATALDAVKSGLATHLIAGATKPVTPAGGKAAVKAMREAGIVID